MQDRVWALRKVEAAERGDIESGVRALGSNDMGKISIAIALATAVSGFISQSDTIPKSPGFQKTITQVNSVAVEANTSDSLQQALSLLSELRQRRNPQPYSPALVPP